VRVDFVTYSKVERGARLRAGLFFAAAAVVGAGSFLWVGLCLLVVAVSTMSFDERLAVIATGLVGGLPVAGAAVLLVRGSRARARLRTLNRLALLVRRQPGAAAADVARELGLDAAAAEALLFDACVSGVLLDDAARDRSAADAVTAPPLPAQGPATAPAAGAEPPPRAAAPAPAARPRPRARPWHPGPSEAAAALDRTLSGALLNGTYQIEDRLGAGAMGVVYVARQVRTGRRYAVKALVASARPSPDAVRRFRREAKVLSSLGHPGIVAVHDYDVGPDGTAFMVMDLLEGETLESRLGWRGSLPWPEARAIARQLGAALAAAHGAGVLHRDLKPSNVFLALALAPGQQPAPAERAVLLDFGLAKPLAKGAASAITRPQQVLGTPLYMAPEQARGEPVDRRTDVYGLGAVLFEMVTGSPPFLDASLARLYSRLLDEPPPRASDAAITPVPPDADQLIARALAKAPADRFETAEAFLDALDRIADPAA
jgi:serine/threonine-protein kinase